MTHDYRRAQAQRPSRPRHRGLRRGVDRAAGADRRPAWIVSCARIAGTDDVGRARRSHRDERAIRPRVAQCAGRLRLRALPRGHGALRAHARSRRCAFADEDSPAFIVGAFETALAAGTIASQADRCVPHGRRASAGTSTTTRCSTASSASSAPDTTRNLVAERGFRRSTASRPSCASGARVADIGCGHGASTILMAQAFPASQFIGLRLSRGIDRRGQRARTRGRRRRPLPLRSRQREGLPGTRLRSRDACSTRCTTWAIRSGASRHVLRRSRKTEPG